LCQVAGDVDDGELQSFWADFEGLSDKSALFVVVGIQQKKIHVTGEKVDEQ
jgi:hypothetical protein